MNPSNFNAVFFHVKQSEERRKESPFFSPLLKYSARRSSYLASPRKCLNRISLNNSSPARKSKLSAEKLLLRFRVSDRKTRRREIKMRNPYLLNLPTLPPALKDSNAYSVCAGLQDLPPFPLQPECCLFITAAANAPCSKGACTERKENRNSEFGKVNYFSPLSLIRSQGQPPPPSLKANSQTFACTPRCTPILTEGAITPLQKGSPSTNFLYLHPRDSLRDPFPLPFPSEGPKGGLPSPIYLDFAMTAPSQTPSAEWNRPRAGRSCAPYFTKDLG
ncbi:hypothetical protein CEXT_788751 [Caerostris extrusa]|uniref:Uncharacterized protein n=1 Tax=Caerostris extrusa TaxID=172846 RepID=A0AAV4XT42_CAEEX|nr:hypothetical protein CEXT_788751 [Caerostris extrusa]